MAIVIMNTSSFHNTTWLMSRDDNIRSLWAGDQDCSDPAKTPLPS